MSKLQVIIASTRPTRAADVVALWVASRAREHPGLDVEVLDLREWPLLGSSGHVRGQGEPPPAVFRMRAALAKVGD
jgi:NAD(P)H-dependent FMN reductase